eukprot:GILJ01003485.1.p1 GENE.GILJ01003485.1~~GILJ01003485.1.p1  ORF type:complete len:552 (+),score=93.11 GILJ01003485.1:115-1770(+)
MSDFQSGQRIICGDDRGTVRYVGTVASAPDPNETWVGIEWDDAKRGKHDGTVQGVRYFTCEPGFGSLVKPEKLHTGISFVEALELKYRAPLSQEEEQKLQEELYVPTTRNRKLKIELVGMDKIKEKQDKIEELADVSLHNFNIGIVNDETTLRSMNLSVTELHLDMNLLWNWSQVCQLVRACPQLHSLALTSNRLVPLPGVDSELDALKQLKLLILNDMKIDWKQVELLAPYLPNLEELHLCHNNLTVIGEESTNQQPEEAREPSMDNLVGVSYVDCFPNLQVLNLDHNRLKNWQQIWKLSKMPKLSKLQINANGLTEIVWPMGVEQLPFHPFSALRSISVNDNEVANWASIDSLNRFGGIEELRIRDNPLNRMVGLKAARNLFIARIKSLTLLNGSQIRARERADAEKAYLKEAVKDMIDHPTVEPRNIEERHPRFVELAQAFGDPRESSQMTSSASQTLADNMISVHIRSLHADSVEKAPVARKLPLTMTVKDVKVLCSRLYKVDPSKQLLSFREDQNCPYPDILDDDMRQLSFYGLKSGGQIWMELKS